MKKIKNLTFLLTFILVCLPTVAHADVNILYSGMSEHTIAGGLSQREYNFLTPNGWMNVDAIVADMGQTHLSMRPIYSDNGVQNLVTTKTLVTQNKALAGVNADFFTWANSVGAGKGSPINAVVRDGRVISSGGGIVGMEGFMQYADGTLGAGYYSAQVYLKNLDSAEEALMGGMNKFSDLNQPFIYTPDWGAQFKSVYPGMYKIIVEDGVVIGTTWDVGTVDIPKNGFVIASLENKFDFAKNIQVGTRLQYNVTCSPNVDTIKSAIGAGTFLLSGGIETPITHGPSGRNPRSGIGTDSTGRYLYLVTVDGRQDSSIGATLSEFAGIMKQIGCSTAVNFDGGGSTALASQQLDGTFGYVNSPTENRAVANIAAIVSNQTTAGALAKIEIKSEDKVFSNTSCEIRVDGFDSAYNVVNVDNSYVTYSISGVSGAVVDGFFRPTSPGTATITATFGNATATKTIKVLGAPSALVVSNKKVDLTKNAKVYQTVTGKDLSGTTALINLMDLNLTLPNCAVRGGNYIEKSGSGSGVASISLGDVTTYFAINAGNGYPSTPSDVFIADTQNTDNSQNSKLKVAVFGTSNFTTVATKMMLGKVSTAMNSFSDFKLFAATMNLPNINGEAANASKFNTIGKGNNAFVTINNVKGGIAKTDYSQWSSFTTFCKNASEKNIFIVTAKDVAADGFSDERERKAFYEVIDKNLVARGKNVYVISNNAIPSAYRSEGVRYINISNLPNYISKTTVVETAKALKYLEISIDSNDNVTYQQKSVF
ncbi:MAG: phosphodiester glycosidase family protein [Clostridiales bacterium]|jgi:hypothetical protein|nr:phosphodiester glycosidase family protein [Clostridiales bacterium]